MGVWYFLKILFFQADHNWKMTGGFDCRIILAYRTLVEDFLSLVGINSIADEQVSAKSEELLLEPILSEFINFRSSVRNYALALDEVCKAWHLKHICITLVKN